MKKDWIKAGKILKNAGLSTQAGVVVLPTDTIYGIVGSAMSKEAVRKIYKIKGRTESKPFIILINSYKQLELFKIKLDENQAKILKKFWPGKVSIILTCGNKKFEYIHRGTNSIAFRMIGKSNKNLFNLIENVGPLVAPSANIQGLKPATNIKEAKLYFKNNVDLYINGGQRKIIPSTLVRLKKNKFEILRQGQVKIKE